MSNSYPPVVLVKTWLQLLTSDTEPQAKQRALRNITSIFATVDSAVTYVDLGELKKVG